MTSAFVTWWRWFGAEVGFENVSPAVDESARLVEQLGFDSLMLYEAIVKIEGLTGRVFPEETIAEIRTAGDLFYWAHIAEDTL